MTGNQVDLIIAYLDRKNYGQFYSNHPQQFCTFFSSDILEICICGGAVLLAKRPKTVKRGCRGRIQRGDMAGIGSAP